MYPVCNLLSKGNKNILQLLLLVAEVMSVTMVTLLRNSSTPPKFPESLNVSNSKQVFCNWCYSVRFMASICLRYNISWLHSESDHVKAFYVDLGLFVVLFTMLC